MIRPYLPLNALRAFEASARHLSFTRAAIELNVTQAAISRHVKALEERLNVELFKRLPRGLLITAEGEALAPVLRDSFDRIADMLERFDGGKMRETLSVGAVGAFAVGVLTARLPAFRAACPHIDLRLSTNNNRVDAAAEGLDYAVRFGAGDWRATVAERLMDAPLTVLCAPAVAATLRRPADVLDHVLLRSYRADEWGAWLAAAGAPHDAPLNNAVIFDSSVAMVAAAMQGAGVALAPARLFAGHLASGALRRPFGTEVSVGCYWLTRLKSRPVTPAMAAFRDWLFGEIGETGETG